MRPANWSAWPTGRTMGTALAPSSSVMRRTTSWKSAPLRSILFTNAMTGTSYLAAWRQTLADWGSTPPTPQKRATAPSRTRSDRSTSTVKSTWPGVSMRLIRWSRHSTVVAAAVIVMPRSRSCSIQSRVALPSWTSPILWVLPVKNRMRSLVDVLPASMWAMIPILRMFFSAMRRGKDSGNTDGIQQRRPDDRLQAASDRAGTETRGRYRSENLLDGILPEVVVPLRLDLVPPGALDAGFAAERKVRLGVGPEEAHGCGRTRRLAGLQLQLQDLLLVELLPAQEGDGRIPEGFRVPRRVARLFRS